jgi:carbon-monoxide dehydrogenase small subunit
MKKLKLNITVNGISHTLRIAPNLRLLDLLREELHLTGTKEGCGIGECGACTVILDGRAVNSCLILAGQCEGREITTIEGVTPEDGLNPLQQSFLDNGAVQCGFCTPGMILSATALLHHNSTPTEAEIREAISGNLCRCTGYTQIVEAIQAVADGSKE